MFEIAVVNSAILGYNSDCLHKSGSNFYNVHGFFLKVEGTKICEQQKCF